MPLRVTLHGWLKIGVGDPDGLVDLTLPGGTDVAEVIEVLREASPRLDPRACLAMVGGASVPLDRTLENGEELHLYLLLAEGKISSKKGEHVFSI